MLFRFQIIDDRNKKMIIKILNIKEKLPVQNLNLFVKL